MGAWTIGEREGGIAANVARTARALSNGRGHGGFLLIPCQYWDRVFK